MATFLSRADDGEWLMVKFLLTLTGLTPSTMPFSLPLNLELSPGVTMTKRKASKDPKSAQHHPSIHTHTHTSIYSHIHTAGGEGIARGIALMQASILVKCTWVNVWTLENEGRNAEGEANSTARWLKKTQLLLGSDKSFYSKSRD